MNIWDGNIKHMQIPIGKSLIDIRKYFVAPEYKYHTIDKNNYEYEKVHMFCCPRFLELSKYSTRDTQVQPNPR